MSIASKFGIKAIRTTDTVINTSILVAILLLFAFGTFSLWDNNQIHSMACSSRYERYRPTGEDGGMSFLSLQEMNQDVFAWLTVFGTNIDYPVVQGRDNWQYINTNVHGRHSLGGAIFLCASNCRSFSDFNNIVHGHNMANRVMFGEINYFNNAAFFNSRRYGSLFFDGREHGIEFFAFIHVDAHDLRIYRTRFGSDAEKQAHIDHILNIAIHTHPDIAATITTNCRLIMLNTCAPNVTHMRDVLIGVIRDEVRPDPFYTENETIISFIPTLDNIDAFPDLLGRLGDWGQAALMAVAFLLVLLACIIFFGKKTVAVAGVAFFIAIAFAQTANASGTAQLTLTVQQTAPEGAMFSYRLAGSGFPNIDFTITGTNQAYVGPIIFNNTGTFNFTLQSTSPDRTGFTIDRRVYNITISVTNDMQFIITVYRGGVKVYDMHFVHTQHPPSGGGGGFPWHPPGGGMSRPPLIPPYPPPYAPFDPPPYMPTDLPPPPPYIGEVSVHDPIQQQQYEYVPEKQDEGIPVIPTPPTTAINNPQTGDDFTITRLAVSAAGLILSLGIVFFLILKLRRHEGTA